MKTQTKLVFEVDLIDPEAVHNFPASFAEYLVRAGHESEAYDFLDWLRQYVEHSSTEDLSLDTIVSGASLFAERAGVEIYDISGVPVEQNSFLRPHGADDDSPPMTAEEILEELDRDIPLVEAIEPETNVSVLVEEGDSTPFVFYKALTALSENNYRRTAQRLKREVMAAVRSKCINLDVVAILMSYAHLVAEPTLEKEEDLIRKIRIAR